MTLKTAEWHPEAVFQAWHTTKEKCTRRIWGEIGVMHNNVS